MLRVGVAFARSRPPRRTPPPRAYSVSIHPPFTYFTSSRTPITAPPTVRGIKTSSNRFNARGDAAANKDSWWQRLKNFGRRSAAAAESAESGGSAVQTSKSILEMGKIGAAHSTKEELEELERGMAKSGVFTLDDYLTLQKQALRSGEKLSAAASGSADTIQTNIAILENGMRKAQRTDAAFLRALLEPRDRLKRHRAYKAVRAAAGAAVSDEDISLLLRQFQFAKAMAETAFELEKSGEKVPEKAEELVEIAQRRGKMKDILQRVARKQQQQKRR